jgi:hypothetical protein
MKNVKILLITVFMILAYSANAQDPYEYNQGELVFCDNTDNDVNPITVYTSASTSTPVNFCIKFPTQFKDGGAQVINFGFEIYKIENGEEKHVNDFLMRMDTGFMRYATENGTYFREPGQYVVYVLDARAMQQGYKRGGYTEYFAKNTIDIN